MSNSFLTPWAIACQAPLSMGFPRQEYLSGLPFPSSESESESHSVVSDPLQPHGLYSPRNSPGQNTGVGSLSLLQRIFPTNPGIEPRSPALQADSLISPKVHSVQFSRSVVSDSATPWIIQSTEFSRPEYWSGWPFSSPGESSQPRDQTQISRIAGRFFTSWATREVL